MDRKAWIVLALCGVLLAVNIHYSQKNAKALRDRQAKELAEKAKNAPEKDPAEADTPPAVDPRTGEPVETPDVPAVPVVPKVDEELVELKSSEATFVFTNKGGGVKHAEFTKQYAVGEEERGVRLNRFGKHPVGKLTSGPDEYLDIVYEHKAEKKTDRSVTFLGKTADGLYVRKVWTLFDPKEPGSGYRLHLELTFENHSEKKIDLKDLGIFAGSAARLWKGEWEQHTSMFYMKNGDFISRKVAKFKKGKKPAYAKSAGVANYAGVSNQFFATIIAPKEPYDAWVWANRSSAVLPEVAGGAATEVIRGGLSLPGGMIDTGGDKQVTEFEIFMGPKRTGMLGKIGMKRGKVMDYGMFKWISWPLNKVLNILHTWIFDPISKNWSWGYAIVALTILIRALMWPLQNKSTRAMKRMSKLQPQIKELKEKYPDDPQKMNQEMMKMYKEYGINPLGGCLPLLVQIPIFFGFYRMLMFAVELRQQKFMWVEDLSQPDTVATLPFSLPFLGDGVNLLPIVMAATMVLQMALTPKTGDKMQRRLFMLMPVIFFFFCYNFASALALYWTTSNIFAIAQTLIMKRFPEPELKKKKSKKGFWQKMQERAEDAQKMQKARRAESMGAPQKKPKKRRPKTGG